MTTVSITQKIRYCVADQECPTYADIESLFTRHRIPVTAELLNRIWFHATRYDGKILATISKDRTHYTTCQVEKTSAGADLYLVGVTTPSAWLAAVTAEHFAEYM
jgi:hypothetical protein